MCWSICLEMEGSLVVQRMLSQLWQYREFIGSCVKREFLAKYRGSIMGVAWSVFQPLAMIIVYTVIFSNVMQNKLAGMETTPYSYSIYLCAGTLPWNMFNEMLMTSVNIFLANANLMKKVSFPRICLPAVTACSSFLNFLIAFSLFLLFLLAIGRFPWEVFPAFFVLLAVQVVFSMALGVGLGVMNVFFRDVGQLLSIVLQFWFWFTPIVYPARIIPEALLPLMRLNPMYVLVSGYQDIFLYGRLPDFRLVGAVLVLALALGAWSLRLYRRHAGELVDEL